MSSRGRGRSQRPSFRGRGQSVRRSVSRPAASSPNEEPDKAGASSRKRPSPANDPQPSIPEITPGAVGRFVGEHSDDSEGETARQPRKKPKLMGKSKLVAIAADREKAAAERQRIIAERSAAITAAKQKRAARWKAFSPRTKRGQPVMAGRLGHLLSAVEASCGARPASSATK